MTSGVSVEDKTVEAVARSLCRRAALRVLQQGDSNFDLQAYVDAHWTSWGVDAQEAISAYRDATQA